MRAAHTRSTIASKHMVLFILCAIVLILLPQVQADLCFIPAAVEGSAGGVDGGAAEGGSGGGTGVCRKCPGQVQGPFCITNGIWTECQTTLEDCCLQPELAQRVTSVKECVEEARKALEEGGVPERFVNDLKRLPRNQRPLSETLHDPVFEQYLGPTHPDIPYTTYETCKRAVSIDPAHLNDECMKLCEKRLDTSIQSISQDPVFSKFCQIAHYHITNNVSRVAAEGTDNKGVIFDLSIVPTSHCFSQNLYGVGPNFLQIAPKVYRADTPAQCQFLCQQSRATLTSNEDRLSETDDSPDDEVKDPGEICERWVWEATSGLCAFQKRSKLQNVVGHTLFSRTLTGTPPCDANVEKFCADSQSCLRCNGSTKCIWTSEWHISGPPFCGRPYDTCTLEPITRSRLAMKPVALALAPRNGLSRNDPAFNIDKLREQCNGQPAEGYTCCQPSCVHPCCLVCMCEGSLIEMRIPKANRLVDISIEY